MRRTIHWMIVLAVFVVFVAGCARGRSAVSKVPDIPPELRGAFAGLSTSEFRAHLAFLSDDLLEGREAGTRGHEIAARYVAGQFEQIGLEVGGDHGTYLQRVPLRETTTVPECSTLVLVRGGRSQALRFRDDFLTWAGPDGTAIHVEAPVVFVNYGVSAPLREYDDYTGVDVRGKVVAMLDGAPRAFSAEEQAYFGAYPQKRRAAERHGAIGIIVLDTPEDEAAVPWPQYVNTFAPVWSLREPTDESAQRINADVALSPGASAGLFKAARKTYEQALADADGGGNAFALPVSIRLHVAPGRSRDRDSPNVVGILRGADPALKNEYVVYSAHLDHLGIGEPVDGDAIYNGTVDNASGSAALLLLARAFASLPRRPARSIVFLSTTAEEEGFFGSEYFARRFAPAREALVADLNMDGAPVTYRFKDVVAVGAEHSSLGALAQRDLARLGLVLSPDPSPDLNVLFRTDAWTFVQQGIPSMSVEEGDQAQDSGFDAHHYWEQWRRDRYHHPSDDMSQRLDLTAAVEYLRPMLLIGWDIANDPRPPTWKAGDFFGQIFQIQAPLRP